MVAIKNMDMPSDCWKCDLTYDNTSGLTICALTGKALYPMGKSDTRAEDCPLIDLENQKS